MNSIAESLQNVRQEISQAAAKSGRNDEEIELIAVSKGHDPDKILEAIGAGQQVFGESKVQEARSKIPLLPSSLRWHFIGHLQKNKVRHALTLFNLIHSVDSVELAKDIDRLSREEGLFPNVLLEVNVGGEGTKFGFQPEQLRDNFEVLLGLSRLSIEGLMCIPPVAGDTEKSRPFLVSLRRHRDALEREFGVKLPQLSMGMSNDFVVAIEEGATMVRVGTAIFGPRSKPRPPS